MTIAGPLLETLQPWRAPALRRDAALSRASEDDARNAARWYARHDERLVRICRSVADVIQRHHPVTLEGTEYLPEGPALLVGNHGHLGYETMLFFAAIARYTGCLPRGLADRWFFRVPFLRDVLVRVGGAYGHPDNARRLLEEGHWVVCYPGGAREVLKRSNEERYRLRWGKSRGFARIALEMGVPIVPFAAAGVDDTFDVTGSWEGTGRFLMGHDKYDLPRLRGLGGLKPRAVPFLFRFGEPIVVGQRCGREVDALVDDLHERSWRATQRLLDRTVRTWLRRHGAAVYALQGGARCAH